MKKSVKTTALENFCLTYQLNFFSKGLYFHYARISLVNAYIVNQFYTETRYNDKMRYDYILTGMKPSLQ